MKFEEFKKEFDQILDAMTEQELIGVFENLGCEFEPITNEVDIVEWCPEHANFVNRGFDPNFEPIEVSALDPTAADSNELALAA